MRWIRENDEGHINAFFGSREAYEAIPGWGEKMPSLDHDQPYQRLDHGYDETKETLEVEDLHQAATFRGGVLLGSASRAPVESRPQDGEGGSPDGESRPPEGAAWSGDMHEMLSWSCCQGHAFEMTPHTVLKGGHWCPECIAPPWDYSGIAKKNLFAAQVMSNGTGD